MIRISGILAIAFASAQWATAQEAFSPLPIERYEPIWRISPFVAVTDVSGQKDNLSGRYAITGLARVGGNDLVFLFDRTTLERFALEPGKARGSLALQSVSGAQDIKTAQVTLAESGGTAVLSYDPKALPAPVQQNLPQGRQQPPHPAAARRNGHPGNQPQNQQQAQVVNQGSNPNAAPPQPLQTPPRRIIRRSRGIVAPQ